MKLNVRDLFWVTLVAGLLVALWIERSKTNWLQRQNNYLQENLDAALLAVKPLLEAISQPTSADDAIPAPDPEIDAALQRYRERQNTLDLQVPPANSQ